jgi:hypothetical protein
MPYGWGLYGLCSLPATASRSGNNPIQQFLVWAIIDESFVDILYKALNKIE